MNAKILGFAAILISSSASPVLAQAVVTPEQVMALPANTKYYSPDPKVFFTVTKGVFSFQGPLKCTGLTKAGGKGNATVNCERPATGKQYRYEWIDLSRIKVETWPNMAAKAGTLKNQPAHTTEIFTR